MNSRKMREQSIGKKKSLRSTAILLVPLVALILGGAAPQIWALEIAEAELFFEFNSTDLALGFDIFLDADPWVEAILIAPDGMTEFLIVDTGGGLEEKGNTEIMTESAEPSFSDTCADPEDCTPAEIAAAIAAFQTDFPEGTWEIEVVFLDLTSARAPVELSHDLPAAPEIIRPREGAKLKNVKNIRWEDTSQGGDPEIISYEVVAEMVIDGETFKTTATIPGDARKFTIAKEFRSMARHAKKQGTLEEYKAEVIARADNLNKTITEVVIFEPEEDEEEEEEEE